jgi:ParB family chromosome partitioning protein
MEIISIALAIIDEPDEPHRLGMDNHALEELASSIALEGLKQPISVRPKDGGRYEIIAGHRRYCAHQMIGRAEIECIVRDEGAAGSEVERFTENMQREQLTPMEEALALSRFMENSGLDVATICKRLSKTESWVRTRLALMGLSDALKTEVHSGRLAIASALALSRVTDNQHRDYLTRYAIEGGASATVIKQWVDAWLIHVESGDAEPAPTPDWNPGDAVVIIQIPCVVCGTPTDHRNLAIVRCCHACLDDLAKVRAEHQAHAASG